MSNEEQSKKESTTTSAAKCARQRLTRVQRSMLAAQVVIRCTTVEAAAVAKRHGDDKPCKHKSEPIQSRIVHSRFQSEFFDHRFTI